MTTIPLAEDLLPSRSRPQLRPVSTASEKKREYVRWRSGANAGAKQLARRAAACSRGAGGRASRRSGRASGAGAAAPCRFRCGVFTTRRPPGFVTRASSARERRLVGHVLEHVDDRHAVERAGRGTAGGRRSRGARPRRPASGSTPTASSVRSPDAHVPPRSRSSRLTTPLSEPRSRQRRPVGRAEHRRDLGELALLQDRAAEERLRPVARVPRLSHALEPQDDGRSEGASEAGGRRRRLEPAREAGRAGRAVERHREEELPAPGRSAGSRARRTRARSRRRRRRGTAACRARRPSSGRRRRRPRR